MKKCISLSDEKEGVKRRSRKEENNEKSIVIPSRHDTQAFANICVLKPILKRESVK